MNRFRRPSPAMLVAMLALFVALGGSSYAALTVGSNQIANNSVRSKDLRNNDVRSGDIRNRAIVGRDVKRGALTADLFAAGQLPKGDRGERGPQGEPGPFPAVLPSGKTLTGTFSINGGSDETFSTDSISFPFPLAAKPTEALAVPLGMTSAVCTGSPTNPTAPPGVLCAYEALESNSDSQNMKICDFTGGCGEAERYGGSIESFQDTPGSSWFTKGSWAVTAP